MKKISININDIKGTEIAGHGNELQNYVHNQTPVLLIAHELSWGWEYTLLTGGHRYNSAVANGFDRIDAYAIDEDKIDFNANTLETLWNINDEEGIIKVLGADNFD